MKIFMIILFLFIFDASYSQNESGKNLLIRSNDRVISLKKIAWESNKKPSRRFSKSKYFKVKILGDQNLNLDSLQFHFIQKGICVSKKTVIGINIRPRKMKKKMFFEQKSKAIKMKRKKGYHVFKIPLRDVNIYVDSRSVQVMQFLIGKCDFFVTEKYKNELIKSNILMLEIIE